MSIILNLETATKNCSVALAKEGKTIACKEIAEQNFSHAEKLHVFIEELLAENHLNFSDLNSGRYLLYIYTTNGRYTENVLKN